MFTLEEEFSPNEFFSRIKIVFDIININIDNVINAVDIIKGYSGKLNDSQTRQQITNDLKVLFPENTIICDGRNNTPQRISDGELHIGIY